MAGSSSSTHPLWTVVESPGFWLDLQFHGIDAETFDEALEGVTWTIARDPWFYSAAASHIENLRIAHVPALWLRQFGIPDVYIVYTIHPDVQQCILQALRPA